MPAKFMTAVPSRIFLVMLSKLFNILFGFMFVFIGLDIVVDGRTSFRAPGMVDFGDWKFIVGGSFLLIGIWFFIYSFKNIK